MKINKIFFLIIASMTAYFTYPDPAFGKEKYPTRPIELVVPMGPGGATDLSTRCWSDQLSRELKVPVIVVNRAGGTGVQGATYVSKARKDGYTLMSSHAAPITTMPIINKKAVSYHPLTDFEPLGQFCTVASLFVVRTESPFKTMKDLVEYARKNPGVLKSAQGGIGTASHFNQLLLCGKNNLNITPVPFQSGAESIAALLGGHVDMATNTFPVVYPHIKAGKLRGLAITSSKRAPELPDVPTTAEAGFPYVNFIGWYGAFAPAGVPQPVLEVLYRALQKVFNHPEVKIRAQKAGFMLDYKSPKEFKEFIQEEYKTTEKLARDAGLI